MLVPASLGTSLYIHSEILTPRKLQEPGRVGDVGMRKGSIPVVHCILRGLSPKDTGELIDTTSF